MHSRKLYRWYKIDHARYILIKTIASIDFDMFVARCSYRRRAVLKMYKGEMIISIMNYRS